jgi:hypothetical protein
MKFFAVAALFLATALAMPTLDNPPPGGNNPGGNNRRSNYSPCPIGFYSNPQCCSAGVLGIAALDCKNRMSD